MSKPEQYHSRAYKSLNLNEYIPQIVDRRNDSVDFAVGAHTRLIKNVWSEVKSRNSIRRNDACQFKCLDN